MEKNRKKLLNVNAACHRDKSFHFPSHAFLRDAIYQQISWWRELRESKIQMTLDNVKSSTNGSETCFSMHRNSIAKRQLTGMRQRVEKIARGRSVMETRIMIWKAIYLARF